jgi:hypothetical protein
MQIELTLDNQTKPVSGEASLLHLVALSRSGQTLAAAMVILNKQEYSNLPLGRIRRR